MDLGAAQGIWPESSVLLFSADLWELDYETWQS